MKTQLIATKSFSYGGRALKPGALFEAKGSDARLLVAIGRAAYQTRVMTAAPPPAPAPAPQAAPVARKTPAAKSAPRKTAGSKSEE